MRFIISLCLFISLIISACTLSASNAEDIELTSPPTTTQVLSTSTDIPATASNNPSESASPSKTATIICNKQTTWNTYTVAAGDTMFGIAQRGNTTVDTLVSGNCLVDAGLISVGQVLYVPSPIQARPPATVVSTVDPNRYTVELWWIVKGDDGNAGFPVGCGDSIALQQSGIPAKLSMEETIKRAFDYLTDDTNIGTGQMGKGWWNPLSATALTIDTFSIEDDHVTANFSGQLNLVGVCFDAQLEPQIVLNIMSLTGTKSATIYINDENLRDIVDMSGLNTKTTYTWEEFQNP